MEYKTLAKIALDTGYDIDYIKNIAEHCTSEKEIYKYFEHEKEKYLIYLQYQAHINCRCILRTQGE